MKIDEIDFTPFLWIWDFKSDPHLMSLNECEFLGVTWHQMLVESTPSPARDYARKIAVYYERFGNHMPVPIRKELLKSIAG
jgi:hypothetical protein